MKIRYVDEMSISINFSGTGIFFLLFTAFYYQLIDSFSFGTALMIGMSLIGVICLAFPNLPQMVTGSSYRFLFWLVVAVLTSFNNGYLEHGYLKFFVSLPIAIISAYALQYEAGWHKSFEKNMEFFVLVHFAASWLFWLMPGFYIGKIVPMFDMTYRSDLIRWSNKNVLMGFTTHYSASGVLFAYACIFYAARFLSRERKKYDAVLFLLMAISLMMTQKRGPLVCAVITIAILYFIAMEISFDKIFRFATLGIAAVVIFLLVVSFLPEIRNVIDRFLYADDGDITNGRADLYAYAWELFRENPLMGVGWGQYRFQPGSSGLQTHNIYLQILAETGLIGSFFLFFGFAAGLVSTVRKIKACKMISAIGLQSELPFILLFSASFQIFFLLYGLTGNPIYDMICMYPYFLTLAANESISAKKRNAHNLHPVFDEAGGMRY